MDIKESEGVENIRKNIWLKEYNTTRRKGSL
jgi:hypothetical protein